MTGLALARETLESTPQRVVQFLRAVGASAALRALLSRHGFGRAQVDEAWDLLERACGRHGGFPDEVDEEAQSALIELDHWDERGFRLIEATLRHRFPDQANFVLTGLAPSEGVGAVIGVAALLERLEQLESDPAREATRRDDERALLALERRGITRRERDRLAALVQIAERARGQEPSNREELVRFGDEDLARLKALRAWYEEWSDLARAVVLREDHLVRLGLAQQR